MLFDLEVRLAFCRRITLAADLYLGSTVHVLDPQLPDNLQTLLHAGTRCLYLLNSRPNLRDKFLDILQQFVRLFEGCEVTTLLSIRNASVAVLISRAKGETRLCVLLEEHEISRCSDPAPRSRHDLFGEPGKSERFVDVRDRSFAARCETLIAT